jgi:carbamate kinase
MAPLVGESNVPRPRAVRHYAFRSSESSVDRMAKRIAVIAVGGNALTRPGEMSSAEIELAHSRAVASAVVDLVAAGWGVAITHGNGPQVGIAMRRAALARSIDPTLSEADLATSVAESQASLGLILATAIDEELERRRHPSGSVVVMTRAQVIAEDPGFAHPTKPIDVGIARRVVPSPKPIRLLEADAVGELVEAGHVVIAAGGGGIPVVHAGARHRPVDAVIDKDYASALLAIELDARLLAICTNVQGVAVDFGTPTQRWLDELTLTEARRLLGEGQFPPGSMGPKVESALWFLERDQADRTAVITSTDLLSEAINGRAGTRVVRSAPVAVI